MWSLTRASGIVAAVLIVAAVADGLVFSGREGGRRLRPNWWMDLHRGLGGYALAFTGLHLVTAYGADIGAGLAEMFVPGASATATTGFTLGVLALYGLLLTVFTSWPSRLFRRKVWHALHLLSIPTLVAVGLHGWQLGTDAQAPWYVALTLLLVFAVLYPTGLRVSGIARRRLAGRQTVAPSSSEPQPTIATAPSTPSPAEHRALVGSPR